MLFGFPFLISGCHPKPFPFCPGNFLQPFIRGLLFILHFSLYSRRIYLLNTYVLLYNATPPPIVEKYLPFLWPAWLLMWNSLSLNLYPPFCITNYFSVLTALKVFPSVFRLNWTLSLRFECDLARWDFL